MKRNLLMLVLITCAVVFSANATTTTKLLPTQDTLIFNSQPNLNLGASPVVKVASSSFAERMLSLMEFDVSSFAPGTIVQNATVEVYLNANGGIFDFDVYRQTQNWDEGNGYSGAYYINRAPFGTATTITSGGNANSGATWNYAEAGTTTPWTGVRNGFGAGADQNYLGQAVNSTQGFYDPFVIDITSTVQGWIDGDFANEGLIFALPYASGLGERSGSFRSKELDSDLNGRAPRLTVVVPEPATMLLVGFGSLAILKRKKA